MKLVTRKTRKAIEKSVRKAIKRHGPAFVAALAGGLASTIATLASTKAADTPGKSNLAEVVDQAKDLVTGPDSKDARPRQSRRETRQPAADMEGTQSAKGTAEAHSQLA